MRIIRPYLNDFNISQRYKGSSHQGLDLIGTNKTIISCTSGTIAGIAKSCTHNYPKNSSCGCGGGFGNYVIVLESGTNNFWWYGHLSSVTPSLKVGQQINQGTVIGTEGCCGHSTGSHLHLEMRVANVYSQHRNMAELLDVPNVDWIRVNNSYNPPPVNTTPVNITPISGKPTVTYRVYSNGKWWGEINNYNNSNDMGYAGIENGPIQGLVAKVSSGTIEYRVHTTDGRWWGWISQYNINDAVNGFAGVIGKNIDAIQFRYSGGSCKVKYRVSTLGTTNYLPWVTDYNTVNDSGYAGIFGKPIDKLQVILE